MTKSEACENPGMGILDRLQGWFVSPTAPTINVSLAGMYSASAASREQLPAVVRAVALLSADIARVSVGTFDLQGTPTDSAGIALVRDAANPYMDGGAWRAWTTSTAILSGVAYSYIQRDLEGDPVALWPLAPGRVQCTFDGQRPTYTLDQQPIDSYMLVAVLGGAPEQDNPYTAVSPLTKCSSALSLAVLQERVAAGIAEAGRVGKVSITHPGTLSTTAKLDLLDAYMQKHATPTGASRPLVLDEGVRVERLADGGMPGMLDDRKYATMEVARALGVPPQMLYQGDAGALTSQIEIQRQYIDGTLAPWCARIGAALTGKITAAHSYVRLASHELSRGNLRDTAAALKDLVNAGAITINDARAMLHLPRLAEGDVISRLSAAREVERDVDS